MPIGSNQGNIHNLRQGEGFATTIDGRQTAMALLNRQDQQNAAAAKAAAAKKKERDAAKKEFMSFDPAYFYADHAEVAGLVENVQQEAVRLMSEEGIADVHTSANPKAMQWQANKKYVTKVAQTSKDKEAWYMDMRKIRDDEKKASGISNWAEIEDFAYKNSPEQILKNGVPFPKPVFKTPAFDIVGETNKITKTWQELNKDKTMSPDDAMFMTKETFSNPAANEPSGFVAKINQIYNNLADADKKQFIAKAGKNGNTPEEEFMAHRFLTYSGQRVDLEKEILTNVGKIGTSDVSIEEGKKTVSTKGVKDAENKVRKSVASTLKANDGQIERDVQDGKYGDTGNTIEENYKAAEDYYTEIGLASIDTKYKESYNEGAGFGDKEIDMSTDVWYDELNSGDPERAQEAALFLYGSKSSTGDGQVNSAKVMDGLGIPLSGAEISESPSKIESVNNKFLLLDVERGFKAPPGSKVIDFDEEEIKRLEEETGLKNVQVFELTPTNRQAFKKLYKEGVKSQKAIYEPSIKPETKKGKFD
jgi:hypothetical protein